MNKPAKLAFEKIASKGSKKRNLIILHGMLGNKFNFRGLSKRPEMSGEADAYLLDLRNHGESEHKPTSNIEDYSNDITHFMDTHGIEDAVLLGHSMGGKAAMKTAMDQPKRIKGLILADIGPYNYADPAQFPNIGNVELLTFMQNLRTDQLTREQIREKLGRFLEGKTAVVDFVMTNIAADKDGKLKWRVNLPAIINSYENFSSYVPEEGRAYSGPTLSIYGTRSEFMPKERFPEFKNYFTKMKLERDFKPIEGGHWVHFVDPESFLRYVQGFQQSLH